MSQIDSKYFREYRGKLGFTNQSDVKSFFAAKDIIPDIDNQYIESLNIRLLEMLQKLNAIITIQAREADIESFSKDVIIPIFLKLKTENLLRRFNNQGRRAEEVYFSWMRGLLVAKYFTKTISLVFAVPLSNVKTIGDDNIAQDNFRRTPKADLEVLLNDGKKIRIEIQAGFQGINDIKQHKVLEARRILKEKNISSWVIHFDLFNGQVAFVKLDNIEDNNINWITRQQMEGQTVFNIEQNLFSWKLIENLPTIEEILENEQ